LIALNASPEYVVMGSISTTMTGLHLSYSDSPDYKNKILWHKLAPKWKLVNTQRPNPSLFAPDNRPPHRRQYTPPLSIQQLPHGKRI